MFSSRGLCNLRLDLPRPALSFFSTTQRPIMYRAASVLTRALLLVLSILLLANSASARRLWEARIQTGSAEQKDGTNALRDLPDIFDTDNLVELFGAYDPRNDPLLAKLDLRGLPALIRWDDVNFVLTIDVPGVPQLTFDSPPTSTDPLEEAFEKFEDWLHGDFDAPGAASAALTAFLQALVAESPVDPVAGNPNSLMSRMTGHDYKLGGEGPFIYSDRRIPDAPDQTGIGLLFNYASVDIRGNLDVETLELPFDHRFNLRRFPNLSLLFSFPLTATFTNREWSVMGSIGLGFQYRPFEWWALTPMFRLGASGSIDVGAAAFLYSATLNSDIHFPLSRFVDGTPEVEVHIVNQLGISESLGFEIGDFKIDYDLSNGVFRNGGYVRGTFGQSGWGWRFFGNDTRFSGSDLFFQSHADIGAAVLRAGNAAGFLYESLSLDVSYFGDFDAYNGISLMLRGRF
jgi:hypothetical protein